MNFFLTHDLRFLGVSFDPRDIWTGFYWTKERHISDYPDGGIELWCTEFTLYICVIPMFPFKFRYYYDFRSSM